MNTADIIRSFQRSEDPDRRQALLFEIGDHADEMGLRFLVDLLINQGAEENDRLAAIEILKWHARLPGSTYAFMNILAWLESGDADEDMASQACPLVRFCGYVESDWRNRVIQLLSSDVPVEIHAGLITDIGIHGKAFFSHADLSTMTRPENREYVEFARRQWARQ